MATTLDIQFNIRSLTLAPGGKGNVWLRSDEHPEGVDDFPGTVKVIGDITDGASGTDSPLVKIDDPDGIDLSAGTSEGVGWLVAVPSDTTATTADSSGVAPGVAVNTENEIVCAVITVGRGLPASVAPDRTAVLKGAKYPTSQELYDHAYMPDGAKASGATPNPGKPSPGVFPWGKLPSIEEAWPWMGEGRRKMVLRAYAELQNRQDRGSNLLKACGYGTGEAGDKMIQGDPSANQKPTTSCSAVSTQLYKLAFGISRFQGIEDATNKKQWRYSASKKVVPLPGDSMRVRGEPHAPATPGATPEDLAGHVTVFMGRIDDKYLVSADGGQGKGLTQYANLVLREYSYVDGVLSIKTGSKGSLIVVSDLYDTDAAYLAKKK